MAKTDEQKLVKVDAQALKDFQVCERYYDYKYNDKKKIKKNIRERRVERFSETIRDIATFFFYKKQGFSEPSYQALEHRWQKLWFKPETTTSDIVTARNEILWESDISYATQAASALMAFHEDFYNRLDLEVILIREPFLVPITKGIAIEGEFDVVLRQKGEVDIYHVYKWVTTDLKKPSSFWLFDFAMLDYAFRYRNQDRNFKVKYYIWDFGSTLPKPKEILVESDDIDSMKYWCNQLVDTKIFVSKRGLTPYCKTCPFDKPCKNWRFKD